MCPAEIEFWLDQASLDQRMRVRSAAESAKGFWLSQRLHPLDVLVAIEAATTVEIIAQRGLRVLGRA